MSLIQANGIDIEYETFGRKGDPALLLIMGLSAQLTMWPVALCEGLAGLGFYVIRFDNRDAGKSTHMDRLGAPNVQETMAKVMSGQAVKPPYALDDMSADAAALLDALGIASAHIVGASMGGMIAQIFAAKYPQKTKSLVSIMSTTGRRDLPPATPEAMAALMSPPASDSEEDRIVQGMKVWRAIGGSGYRDSDDALRVFVTEQVRRVPYDPAAMARQLVAIMAAEPRNAMLAGVKAPALVIHGADDPLVPLEGGKDTAASIPGAKLEIVPGLGHEVTSGSVSVYLRLIGDFLKSQGKIAA